MMKNKGSLNTLVCEMIHLLNPPAHRHFYLVILSTNNILFDFLVNDGIYMYINTENIYILPTWGHCNRP